MKKDWDEQFDANVGLDFGLRAFETYPTSGTLSAEVRAVPGIRGHCQAYLELIEGKLVSCYLIDRTGKRHPFMKESLIKLDEAKGPFNWTFRRTSASTFTTPSREQPAKLSVSQVPFPEQPTQPSIPRVPLREHPEKPSVSQIPFREQTAKTPVPQIPLREQPAKPSASQVPRFPIPIRLVHNLDLRQFHQWTPEQQRCLHMVFSMINGRCGIEEIKEQIPLPPAVVDTVIRILLQLQAIAMQ